MSAHMTLLLEEVSLNIVENISFKLHSADRVIIHDESLDPISHSRIFSLTFLISLKAEQVGLRGTRMVSLDRWGGFFLPLRLAPPRL